MSLEQEAITQYQELLATHRRALEHLFQQHAALGTLTPPYIVLDIERHQAEIRSIKRRLREHSIPVEDHPDDKRPIQVSPVLHQLPPPVGDFVGRDTEIAQLVQAIHRAAEDGAAIGVIRGMGGVGKTQLALKVAQQIKATFGDAQILVRLHGMSDKPLTPAQALGTVIHAFKPGEPLPNDLDQLKGAFYSVLSGKRVLILADDAKDADQVDALLPPFDCALLITSRARLSLPGMRHLDLETLPQMEAAQLLRTICPRIGDAASKLAHLCGYLPLALRVSASRLQADDTCDISDYLGQLGIERLKNLRDPDNLDDPQKDVEPALQLSYNSLMLVAQQVLTQLSVFPASFKLDAALEVVQISDETGWLPRLTQALYLRRAKRPVNPADVLGDLRRRSLLEWDDKTKRYNLHDLVRVFAAERLTDANAVRLRHAQHYARVADRVGELFLGGGTNALIGLILFDQERAHIDAGWDTALARAGFKKDDLLLLAYADAMVNVAKLRYDIDHEYLRRLEAWRQAARRRRRRDDVRAALDELGDANAYLGTLHEAISYYEQSLALVHKLGDEQGEGETLNGLGVAHAYLGEFRKAISCYEQSLALARKLGDEQDEARILCNLGIAHNKLGDTRTAITYYEQSLVIARKVGDWEGEGHTLTNLGSAYAHVGELHKAIACHEQSRAAAGELRNRRGEAQTLTNLGNTYTQLGQLREAIACHEQSLAAAGELRDRRGEAQTLTNLGDTYTQLGQLREALACYEQSLAIARELGDRWGTATASWKFGKLLVRHGDLTRAVEFMRVCVDYEREMGHLDAEKDAAQLEQIRQQLEGSTEQRPR